MEKKFVFAFLVSAPLAFHAQGLLNNGAFIVMTGAANIYIGGNANGDYTSQANGRITPSATGTVTLEGDWNNNSANTGFTADAGTVIMNGGAQSIAGSNSTTFYNLSLQGTGTKTLNIATFTGGVTTTTGVLSLGTRPLALNSFYLTITNPAATAVTYTTGYVISETNVATNPSVMRWNTGAFAGAYTFPFGTTGGIQIPLTVTKAAAVASVIDIATRPTGSPNTPWAGGVTHMFDPTLAQDGSDEAVVDRWWEILVNPAITADVTFRYTGAENTLSVPYNAGNLGAQYWDGSAWRPDNANIGSAAAVLAGVGAVTAPGLSLTATYTPWVLSSLAAPLPVEFVRTDANCVDGNMQVSWTTASELNNDFFTVERSDNGNAFYAVGTVDGSGTTSQLHNYSFTDVSPATGTVYYRIRQTDYNGASSASGIFSATACGTGTDFIDAFASGADIHLVMELGKDDDYRVMVLDARGRLVADRAVSAVEGANRFVLGDVIPATGVYLVTARGSDGLLFTKRLFISRD